MPLMVRGFFWRWVCNKKRTLTEHHDSPPKPSAHWTVRLLFWIAIFLIAHLVNKHWLWPIVQQALTH